MSEWFEDLGAISIGCQSYGPNEPFGDLKVGLWQILLEECPQVSIGPVRHLALALRVGGEFKDFSEFAITHMRVMAKRGYAGCDIEIPVSEYQDKTKIAHKERLVEMVGDAIDVLLIALKKKQFEGNYVEIEQAYSSVAERWMNL